MILILLFSLTIFFSSSSTSQIVESETIKSILPIIQAHSGKKILVLFDLDNTLIRGITYLSSPEFCFARAKQMVSSTTTEQDACIHMLNDYTYIVHREGSKLVEPTSLFVLDNLKKINVPFLGLTGRSMYIAQRTSDVLTKLGIQFSDLLPEKRLFHTPNHPVLYQEGILFCSIFVPKSLALQLFMQVWNEKPDLIIFVDDCKKHLQDVSDFVKSLKIDFVGIRLNACDQFVEALDLDKAEQQFAALKKQTA